jgi:hypothetical protein
MIYMEAYEDMLDSLGLMINEAMEEINYEVKK